MKAPMKIITWSLLIWLLMVCCEPTRASELELIAIAPDHVGFTLQRSPVLYYFISTATSVPVLFTLRDDRSVRSFVEVQLTSPSQPGFWAIRLQDYKIELEEGVQYRWFVSVIPEGDLHAPDIVAGGIIERLGLDEMIFIDGSRGPCDRDQMARFFDSGIWYDGVACLQKLIEANPEDASLRRMRDRLYREPHRRSCPPVCEPEMPS